MIKRLLILCFLAILPAGCGSVNGTHRHFIISQIDETDVAEEEVPQASSPLSDKQGPVSLVEEEP